MTQSAPTRLSLPLDECMTRDRGPFIRRQRQIRERRKAGKPVDQSLEKLREDVAHSCQLASSRRALLPDIEFPDELPVSRKRDEIAAALAQSQVIVVAGETGSGKTTQLPKICLTQGRGVKGLIGHTQPRRIAARTVANRISDELNCPLGDRVGYQVRFTDHTSDHTLVKLMTDGVLLGEIQHDRLLSRYDTLIIDEAHERSLNIDFLLGYLKQILPRRPDLKVIITSATIDVERFSRHFDDAPVISVSGRTYPVDIWYRPPAEVDEDIYQAVVQGVEELMAQPKRGDILVFLSGEREIREASRALRHADLPHLEVVPLYARLSLAEQSRIFQPHKGTRVVLATNVAETSITVPGIRYVIDTGYARISRYSFRTKVQRLPVEPVSQASADQRAGRCGRLSDGICMRLYSEEDFAGRPEFTDPEIVRTNLAAVILQMEQMRIGDIRDFPFVEAPDSRLIRDGYQLLEELQAIDGTGRLTDTGRTLSRLPLDPRLGKMLVTASTLGASREVLAIVAMLSIQDPRERPADKKQAADEKHRQWLDKESDFSSILLLWDHFEEQRQALSRRKFSEYCHKNFVSYLRMRDLVHQLHRSARQAGLAENAQPASYEAIHKSLLSGLLGHVGFRHEGREFLGVRNRKFMIFPGSGLHKKPPKWVVAAEMLETSQLFAHSVARIEPEWIPPFADHLIKRHHSEPYYDSKRGQVMAFERQTLFGLTVVDRKRVPFSAIDPETAGEVFVRGCLVENRYRGKGRFQAHNQKVLRELEELEDRLRRSDLALEDDDLYEFYRQRVPADITTLKGFEKWRRGVEESDPRLLFLDGDALKARAELAQSVAQFPREITWKDTEYRIEYRFEPGHDNDGVTVVVPVSLLNQVPDYLFQWLVPGLLRDKCIALVKSLPKQWRKQLVPVPDYVDKALAAMAADNTPLTDALALQLKRHTGLDIPAEAWNEEALENFYRITYKLVDEKGRGLEHSKDLAALKTAFRNRVQETIEEVAGDDLSVSDISDWNFGRLKESQRLKKGKVEVEVYPALVAERGRVSLKMLDSQADARALSRKGVVQLLISHYSDAAKYLRKNLFKGQALAIVAAGLQDDDGLREEVIAGAYKIACLDDRPLPRTREEFQAALKSGRSRIVSQAQELEAVVLGMLEPLKNIRRLQDKYRKSCPESIADTGQQLAFLLRTDFLFDVDKQWLDQYPRYLRALEMRLEKLPAQEAREVEFCRDVKALYNRLEAIRQRPGGVTDACLDDIAEFPFWVEELRVSVFAQVLKTLRPVSMKRLDKKLTDLENRAAGG